MERSIPYGGYALNAVDAKGRVSLPADIRKTIERRIEQAEKLGLPVEPKRIYVREHPSKPCLIGFDEAEYFRKAERFDTHDAEFGALQEELEGSDLAEDVFGDLQPISFDSAGRMVLNGLLREITGISQFAFFRGANKEFQIWDPVACYQWAEKAGKRPVARTLQHLCADKGIML